MTDTLVPKLAQPKTVLTGSSAVADHSEGMSYLETLPRRLVTLYLPLAVILIVLLFPFYWMALTAIKPDEQLLDLDTLQPVLDLDADVQAHLQAAVRDQLSALAVEHDAGRGRATVLSIIASVLAAYAIVRLRYRGAQWVGGAIFLAYLVPPSILFIPLSIGRVPIRAVRHAVRADPHLSDHPDPVLDLAADGLFQDHPVRA